MMKNQDIIDFICNYTAEYQQKNQTRIHFSEPLVGFASADDPLFCELKTIISPTHALPGDIVPGAKTVIAYFIPFDKESVKDNAGKGEPTESWVYAYHEANTLIKEISEAGYNYLIKNGYKASNLPPTYNYDPELLYSDWSHRSAAYIAGLGKFGLNHSLITKKGCCGRVGSIITDAAFEATPRPQEEYCLYYVKGTCKSCVKHCPVNALTAVDGHGYYNKRICNDRIYGREVPMYPIGTGDVCGKCMSGMPCAHKAPAL